MSGRFGPYVTDGETNATLPQLADPLQVDLNAAVEMIRNRENAPKRTRPAKGAAAKKATAKDHRQKATARKATAKKKAPAKRRHRPKEGARQKEGTDEKVVLRAPAATVGRALSETAAATPHRGPAAVLR